MMLRAAGHRAGGASFASMSLALLLVALTPAQQRSLESGFTCPENLADDAARLQAFTRFMERYARLDPTASVNDRLALRDRLMAKRGCAPDGDKAHYSFPQT